MSSESIYIIIVLNIIVLTVGFIIFIGLIKPDKKQDQLDVNKKSSKPNENLKNIQNPSSKTPTTQIKTGELLERLNDDQIRAIRQEVHHVHHHHVHVTHEVRYKNSSEEDKDHTAAVWERLGYQVKAGETYSYKFYGREIFKPHQVERAGQYRNRIAKSGLSENQLKVKTLGLALVEKTGSKRAAKDILVEDYGFSENTAKYAVGYRGYDDY